MKGKILRKISIYLIALITISLISNIQFVSAVSKEDNDWSIKISNIEIKDRLSTNEAITYILEMFKRFFMRMFQVMWRVIFC